MAQDRKYNTKNTNYVPGRVEKNRATATFDLLSSLANL